MIGKQEHQTYLIALAGLLHDIGKFGQRTGKAGTHGSKKHPAVGDQFVNQHVPREWRGAMAPVGWHHGDPEHSGRLDGLGLPVKIVALADRLSAGEREELEKDSARPKRLRSIFSRLNLGDREEAPPVYLPLEPLRLTRQHIFATAAPLSDEQIKHDYQSLWDGFCAEADTIASAHTGEEANIETYLES
ncbi:MAG: HD domain-containing protein, partial [Candidatus Bipolaricaulota bacterium]|nr:HD domain-containing protein [Candidatus Bipolaricaulota bacterium]